MRWRGGCGQRLSIGIQNSIVGKRFEEKPRILIVFYKGESRDGWWSSTKEILCQLSNSYQVSAVGNTITTPLLNSHVQLFQTYMNHILTVYKRMYVKVVRPHFKMAKSSEGPLLKNIFNDPPMAFLREKAINRDRKVRACYQI